MNVAQLKDAVCPVCRNTGLKPRHTVRGFEYVTCSKCGVVSIFPFPSKEEISRWYSDASYFDQESGNSGYVDYESLKSGFLKTFQRRNRLLGDAFWQQSPRVLEVGCALGFYPESLPAPLLPNYLGIDLNESAVASVRAKGLSARTGDLAEMPFTNAYDLVVAFDVIEHVPDPRIFLKHVARVLRDGGRLLLTTPSITSLLARVSGPKWVSYIVPHHILLYQPGNLSALLAEEGFETVKIEADWQWVPLSFVNSRLSWLLPGFKGLQKSLDRLEKQRGPIFVPVPNGNMLVLAELKSRAAR